MHVSIRNLGPVREADLDLSKRLVILTGPNNSGKTYLTWTLYGVLVAQAPQWNNLTRPVRELAERLVAAPGAEVLPHECADYQARSTAESAAGFASRLSQFFAAPPELFSQAAITVRVDGSDPVTGGTLRVSVTARPPGAQLTSISFGPQIGAPLKLEYSVNASVAESEHARAASELRLPDELDAEQRARIAMSVGWLLALRFPERSEPVLFPAERIAVNVFAKELALKRTVLVDEVLDGAPPSLIAREAGRYPVPIRDGIRMANDLANASKQTSKLNELAIELEEILGGTMALSEAGELVFSPAQAPGRRLPFHVTSSLVKSLASLAFYFRHVAGPDAWVLIDEPELNLHPDLQRRVARFLAKVVNRGVRLIISTHSDYLIRELSNLIRLGERGVEGERIADKLGYDKGALLRAADVGAWLLQDGKANALPVDADGFTVPTIDDAIEAQNRDTQAISFGLPE